MKKPLKVAFDCSGTLLHSLEAQGLFRWFQAKGAEMTIWSGSYSYVKDAAKLMKVNESVSLEDKRYWSSDPDDQVDFVDVAVDDDGWQFTPIKKPLLAAHNIIDVDDIPKDPRNWDAKYGHFFGEGND